MKFYEILQVLTIGIAAIPVGVFLLDLLLMFGRNCEHHIDDNPNAWKDSQLRITTYMINKFDTAYYIYGMMTFVFVALYAGSNAVSYDAATIYQYHIEVHGADLLCSWTLIHIWLPLLYVGSVIGCFIIQTVLTYLRTIRRLEKSTGKLPDEDRIQFLARKYIEILGGIENIDAIDSCDTRLRITLKNSNDVSGNSAKTIGALGLIKLGSNKVQIIIGDDAHSIATDMRWFWKDAKSLQARRQENFSS